VTIGDHGPFDDLETGAHFGSDVVAVFPFFNEALLLEFAELKGEGASGDAAKPFLKFTKSLRTFSQSAHNEHRPSVREEFGDFCNGAGLFTVFFHIDELYQILETLHCKALEVHYRYNFTK
jgi:hypothetical protein